MRLRARGCRVGRGMRRRFTAQVPPHLVKMISLVQHVASILENFTDRSHTCHGRVLGSRVNLLCFQDTCSCAMPQSPGPLSPDPQKLRHYSPAALARHNIQKGFGRL